MQSSFQQEGSNGKTNGPQLTDATMKLNKFADSVQSMHANSYSGVNLNDENSNQNSNNMVQRKRQPVNHYEVPNLSSMLYEYTNRERDFVQQAFRNGNFQTIRDLPDDIKPFNVGQSIKQKISLAALTSCIASQNNIAFNEHLKGDGGVFKKFTWLEDPFDLAEKREREARQASKNKQWATHKVPFNPGMTKRSLKYEFPFLGKDETQTRNFLVAEDPYMLTTDERLRSLWMEESKILYGSFCPSGVEKPLQTITKAKMKEIVDHLKRLLLSDWNDVNFVIGTNPKDLIEIKFDIESADSAHGLNAYMNTLMNSNELIANFNLRKVTQYWPFQDSNSIYFMIAPPWKKLYVNDTVNQSKTGKLGKLSMSEKSVRSVPENNPKLPTLYSREIQIN